MIKLEDLVVTQNGFRNQRQITDMIDFVSKGGLFDRDALSSHSEGNDLRLITIARFEDGRMFIHDGHHRVASIYLGGRKYLDQKEYNITDWKYSDYSLINFEVGWVTPYDPRYQVRIPDYESYKLEVRSRLKISQEVATAFIKKAVQKDWFSRVRTVLTIQDILRYI